MSRGRRRSGAYKRNNKAHRNSLSEQQNHRCAYCSLPMFVYDLETVEDFIKINNLKTSSEYVTKFLSYSCDHVIPDGPSTKDNLVLAHNYCNVKKDRKSVDLYLKEVELEKSSGLCKITNLFKNRRNT